MSYALTYQPVSLDLSVIDKFFIKLFENISKFISLKHLINRLTKYFIVRMVNRMEKSFDQVYISARGFQSILEEGSLSKKNAIELSPKIKEANRKLSRLVSELEGLNYFNNSLLQDKVLLYYSLEYSLERKIRKIALSGEKRVPTSSDFINSLANKSKEAMTDVLCNN